MNDLLDNPIWNAMISFNRLLALGSDKAGYFPKNLSPFTGLATLEEGGFKQLYDFLPPKHTAVFITAYKYDIPDYWQVMGREVLLQMTMQNLNGKNSIAQSPDEVIPLTIDDVPEMIALTKLTNPGPFLKRTIEFGNYVGIFKDGRLVAMAGQRMHPGNNIELSAVCTHPEHSGNGYGSQLILHVANHIIQQGCTPFLHVRPNNLNAISLYQTLGFTVRREMNLDIIQK
jgi:ribosomal protein S18 acetylase RimI-like enzyme